MITVGGVDDQGTKAIGDDDARHLVEPRHTQDGFEKPDVVAPGAHMVSTLAPGQRTTRRSARAA